MGHTYYLTVITESTILDGLHNVYLVNATGPTAIDITLPSTGGSDGINYEIVREDISSCIVTLHAPGGNIIIQNIGGIIGSTGTINLVPQTSLKIRSLNNQWYIVSNSSIQRTNSKILYSTSFGSTNTLNYYQLRGGLTVPICYFFIWRHINRDNFYSRMCTRSRS